MEKIPRPISKIDSDIRSAGQFFIGLMAHMIRILKEQRQEFMQ